MFTSNGCHHHWWRIEDSVQNINFGYFFIFMLETFTIIMLKSFNYFLNDSEQYLNKTGTCESIAFKILNLYATKQQARITTRTSKQIATVIITSFMTLSGIGPNLWLFTPIISCPNLSLISLRLSSKSPSITKQRLGFKSCQIPYELNNRAVTSCPWHDDW